MAGASDRQYWIDALLRIVHPALDACSRRQLKVLMPVHGMLADRASYTYLEAVGRSLTGLAPWLEGRSQDPEEERTRAHYAVLARQTMEAITDPDSPDYCNFTEGHQPIVDAAFLAHAILRAPNELWGKLEEPVQNHVLRALEKTRSRKPYFSNWLLFAAMIETALFKMGAEWDRMRIDFALKQHDQWYLGDGMYSDGPEYHCDYYNSFVIQPMLVDIITTVGSLEPDWGALREPILGRAVRYGDIQEKMISPEGAFPAAGRSITYRFGAFQHLAQMALQHRLPEHMEPAQVRCALTRVIRRIMEAPDNFDENGWLRIGFCGHQPELGEAYISTGSLYLCSAVFLPLGLPEADPFWSGQPLPWSSCRIWSGGSVPIDRALV
ncbi:DUF2264 domain-containing protein [Paenibacillus caseinilyticus]|uniref:DUF2264 domain-containing protein n=1 Tax=Paenibacillus mucilaginosus K02 TaxID=997761 RepID=I0BEJ8_9BACL|nr:DUF2264 domain-containing protein [Paenibacillus mucilaginosus]AFH60795.1 hypothetical protein B2K_08705 [Paenibacillus mucilaginosus K02]